METRIRDGWLEWVMPMPMHQDGMASAKDWPLDEAKGGEPVTADTKSFLDSLEPWIQPANLGNPVCQKMLQAARRIVDMDAEIDRLKSRLESAVEFQFLGGGPGDSRDVKIVKAINRDGVVRWKVQEHRRNLNKSGEWEFEPMPSSRTEEFFARCRFNTFEEAESAVRKAVTG